MFAEKCYTCWHRAAIPCRIPFSSRSKACGEAGRGYCHHLWPSDISIIDYASRYPELLDLALSTSTAGVLNKLLGVFARFGLPVSVVSYGPQFASAEMTEFLTRPTIQHIKPSPRYRVLMVLLSDGTVDLKINEVALYLFDM